MKKVLAVAIIAILFISTFAVLTQMTNAGPSATSKPNISIHPSTKAAAAGAPFSVDLMVSGIVAEQRVIALQLLRVKYDHALLQAINVTEGPFLKDPRWNLDGTSFFSGIDEDFATYGGNVLVGDLLNPNTETAYATRTAAQFPYGEGIFATITFQFQTDAPALELPTTIDLTITDESALILDKPGPGGEMNIGHTNGKVEIARVALDLQPSPAQVRLGESLTMNIVISGVDLDERVTGIQFRLQYDSTLFRVTSVTEGPFMKDSRWNQHGTLFLHDIDENVAKWTPNVLVGVFLYPDNNGVWAKFPNGTGTVATITFKNIGPLPAYAPTTTQLTLVKEDKKGEIVPGALVINDQATPNDEVPSSVSSGTVVEIGLPEPAILSIYPGRSYAVLGHPLMVSVKVNNLKEAWRTIGPQFRFLYDSSLFEVTNVTEGPFMKGFADTTGTSFFYVLEPGSVFVGILLNPDPETAYAERTEYPKGEGDLAIITLNPLRAPGIDDPPIQTMFNLTETLLVNNANEQVGDALHSENPAYVVLLAMKPTIAVEPPLYQAKSVNEIFDVNMTVSELAVGWRPFSIQYKMKFNASCLQALEVTQGPFWQQFGSTLFFWDINNVAPAGYVLVGVLLQPDPEFGYSKMADADFPIGGGTIATVTFNVTAQPRGIDLGSQDVKLDIESDDNFLLTDIPGEIEPGEISYERGTLNALSGDVRIAPTHIADLNSDGKVNMLDIGYVARAFGATKVPLHPRWNASYDIDGNGKVNMIDIALVARAFGWPYST